MIYSFIHSFIYSLIHSFILYMFYCYMHSNGGISGASLMCSDLLRRGQWDRYEPSGAS